MKTTVEPSQEQAERSAENVWSQSVRFVVIDAPLMRAGRGRRNSPAKGRRLATRRDQYRKEDVVGFVLQGLRSGVLSTATARSLVRDTGLEEFIRIAESRDEVVDAFAEFFSLGLWLWTLDHAGPGVVRAIFALRKQLT